MRIIPFFALLLVASTTLAADSPSKYALFVGVAKYKHAEMNKPQLEYPEVDAKELAEIFSKSGYTVDLLLGKQADQVAIKKKLAELKNKGDSDGVVVVGFFGHGVEFESTQIACYLPYDTMIRNVVDLNGRQRSNDDGKPMVEPDPESLITMPELLAALRTSPAGNRILLADCCRTSPNKARGRAFGANLKLTDLPENTAAFFACSANEQAFEHSVWGHGAFTKCLIDEIKTQSKSGTVTAGTLADRLRPKVTQLVASVSGGRDRQTTRSLVTDVVDFQLFTPAPPFEGRHPGATRDDNGLRLKFLWCPPGKYDFRLSRVSGLRFVDGSAPRLTNYPQYSAPIQIDRGFWITECKISKDDFEKVCQKRLKEYDPFVPQNKAFAPKIACTTWTDADHFCHLFSQQERIAGRLQQDELYTLPAFAEWQYAFRAGTTSKYFWGDDAGSANDFIAYVDAEDLSRVKPNPWGLRHTIGLVGEWCRDLMPQQSFGPVGKVLETPKNNAYLGRDGGPFRIITYTLAYEKWLTDASNAYYADLLRVAMEGSVIDGGKEDVPYYSFRVIRRIIQTK